MKKIIEFDYVVEHESKLNSMMTFTVKAEISNGNRLTNVVILDDKSQDVTDLFKFAFEYDFTTIREELHFKVYNGPEINMLAI